MAVSKRFFLIEKGNLLFFLFFINSIITEAHRINTKFSNTTNLLESTKHFFKADSAIKVPEILAGTTKICAGTSTELKVTDAHNGDITWKTSSNEVVGSGSVLKISPKETTTYYAIRKAGERESKPSNKITISVSLPNFTGTPTVPGDYNVTSNEPFYLGTKEIDGVELRWKHEQNTGGVTLITPTTTPTEYYVRYEEPKTGCVSAWKTVSVSLDKSNTATNAISLKNFKPLINTPATSCAALSTSSDAQLCSGTSFAALVGNTTNGGTASTQWGCLGTSPNQSWFYFIPSTSGSVSFNVTNTSNVDVDGAIWGPVNTVADACFATQSSPLTCDYSSSANISLSIASVTAGKVYVLVVTNYSNRATTVNFPANAGTASVGCCTLTGVTTSSTAITCNGGTSTATVNYTGTPTGSVTYSKDGTNYQASNIFSGLSAGSYTFYVKDNICTKFSTLIITQPTAITFEASTITNVTCSDGNNGKIVKTATGGTGTISYVISPNIGTQSPAGTFSNLTAGTYTIMAADASGCTSTTNVTVGAINITPTVPTAISASLVTICSGQSSTLSATCNSGTATWYSDAGLTSTVTSTVSPALTTTYYVSCIGSGGCKSISGNVTITVNPTPTAPTGISASPATICSGQSSTLSATCSTGTVTWYSDVALTNLISNSVSPASTTTYYVACMSASGCKSTAGNIAITVNPTPTAPAGISASPATICSGKSSTLSAACSNGTVTWYNDVALTNTISNSVSPTNTTTYYVACLSNTGCRSTFGNVTVTVNPTPSAPTSISASPATICSGQSSTLSAICSTGTTTWFSDAALTNTVSNTVSPTSTTTYYVSCVSALGCKSPSGNIFITVNPIPSAPTSISASHTTICSGQSSALSATCSSGTATWYTSNALTTEVTSPVSPTSTKTYYVACVSTAGCKSSAGNITVTVNPTPLTPTNILASPATICVGQSTSLIATCASGTITWYTNAALTTTVATTVSPITTTTYHVACVSGLGCKSAAENVTVNVNPTPSAPTGIAASSTTICSGQSSTLTATCSSGIITWYTEPALTNVVSSPVRPTMTTTYYGACVSASGCKSTAGNITITVNQTPATLPSSTTEYCQGITASQLNVVGASGATVLWYNTITGGVGTNTAPTPSTNTVGTTNYYASQTQNGCETERAAIAIVVNPNPALSLEVGNAACAGSPVTIIASATGGTPGYQFSKNGVDFQTNNVFAGIFAGSYTISARDSKGCLIAQFVNITQADPLSLSIQSSNDCTTGDNGIITISGAGGTGALTYNINGSSYGSTTTFSNLSSGTYTVGVKDANGCILEKTLSINTVADIVLSLVSQNDCIVGNTGMFSLSASGGLAPYQYRVDGGSWGGSSFTGLSAGTHIAQVIDARGCTKTLNVEIIEKPAAPTVTSPTICAGQSVNLSATCNTGVPLWYSDVNLTNSLSSVTVTPSATTNYYAVCEIVANNCKSTVATANITVNPIPTVNSITNQVLCNTSTTTAVNFTGMVSGTIYNWTNTNTNIGLSASGSGNILAFTATNSTSSPISGTITATPSYTNQGVTCTGIPQNFTITVNPTPLVNNITDQSLCNGSQTTAITMLGAVTGTIYNWTNSNTSIGLSASGTGNIIAFTATNTGSLPIFSEITVSPSFTNGGVTCTGTPKIFTIAVNPTPTVNTVTNQILCSGATTNAINFTGAVSGTVYNWTNSNTNIGLGGGGSGNIAAFATTNSGSSPNIGTINVTPSYSNNGVTCTGSSQSFTITVNPIPTVNAVMDQTLCNGSQTTQVTFTGAVAGTIYNWTNTNSNIGLTTSGTGNIAAFVATNTGTSPLVSTITVTPSYTNGGLTCTGLTQSFDIIVNPTPTVNAVANQTHCYGSTSSAVNFTGAVSGTLYNWTNTNSNIGLPSSGTGNLAAFTTTNSGTSPINGIVSITPTYTNNGLTCIGSSTSFTITVNPIPTVNAITDQTLCNGTQATAIAFTGAVSGTVYSWTNTNPSIGLAASGTGNIATFTAIITGSSPISGVITTTPSYTNNGVTCSGTVKNFTILVNPTPTVNAVSNQSLCSGTSTSANFIGAVSGTTYNWTNTNTAIGLAASGTGNIATFTVTNTGNTSVTGVITVTPSYTNDGITCVGSPRNFTITVNPIPQATITPDFAKICSGESINLLISDGKSVNGTTTFSWNRDNTTNLSGPNSGSTNSISGVFINPTTTTQITAFFGTVRSQFGCSDMAIAKVSVTPPLSVTISGNTYFCGTGVLNRTTTLTASPVGGTGSYSYQWNLDGNRISGATNSTHTTSTAGDYTVTVVSEYCTKTSNIITVNAPYSLSGIPTVNPASSSFCGSGSASFSANSSVSLGTFNWYNAANSITALSPTSGTRNETYNTPTLTASQIYYVARAFAVVGSSPLITCETDRTAVAVTINSIPTTPTATGSTTICVGSSTNLSISNSCEGTITWKNASNTIVGTGSPLSVSPSVTTNYTAICTVTGCESSSSNTITITVSNITLTATPTNLTCQSNSTGSISLLASGGTTAYTYSKDGSTFQSSNVFSALSAGNYTLTVKDANGCTATASTTLTEPNLLTLTATPTNLTCQANSTGSISLSASGGTTAYTYSKDGLTFQSSNVFSALSAGNYTLMVKDANGCMATASTTLTEPNLLTLTATPTNLTCQSNSTGSISLSASGGTTAYTYSKDGSTFQSSNVFSALSAGNYTLMVKDANGCMATASTTLTEPNLLTLTATPTNLTCQANSTGSISLSASGGTTAYTYSKDGLTFQSSNVFSALSAGNYTLTVKDENGCTATASTTLTEPNLLTLTATPTNLTCQANSTGSISLLASGGTTAYTFSKDGSTFQSSNVFSSLSAGNYILTVKDANGCTATASTTLTEPNLLTLTATPTNLTCQANSTGSISLSASGGTMAYTYSKDGLTFQSSNVFSALSAGNYTLTVKDANGCTATASTTLTEPELLTLTATPTNLTCQSNSTGSISLSASGGTTAYTYSKDGLTFQSSNVFSALSAGNYTLMVKDANGCMATASTTLTEPNLLTLTATPTNLTCQSNSTGSISLLASGGTTAYTYSKDGSTFQSSNVFSALSAGNYTLKVKDANGCTATASTTLTEPELLTLTATPTNLTCQANSTGSISLSASGGSMAYTYSKDGSTFQSSNVFSALSAGNYILTVKDANGCTATASTTLTEPELLTLTATPTNLTCQANSTGSISLLAIGGTMAYTYSKDGLTFQSSNVFSALSAGNYTLTVKDANGCTATASTTLTEPNLLTLTATPTNLTCQANSTGSISLLASGGTMAYTYSKDGSTFQSSNVFSALSAGNYTLTVKDTNGCTATASTTLTQPNLLTLTATPTNLTCQANSTGSISLSASGGTMAYTYSKDGSTFQSSNVFSALSAGNYTLTVKDANGCMATASTTLTEPNLLTLTATPTNLTCQSNSTGSISLLASGGITAYTYSKDGSTFQSSNVFSALSAGNYTLTVKDANGCTATASTTLTEPDLLTLTATPMNLTCQSNSTGSISLLVSGGTTAYTYSKDGLTFQSNNVFSALSAGNYTLTVKDANGCTATASTTLTEPDLLTLTATPMNLTCQSNSTGSISLLVSGGTTAYTYSKDGLTFQSNNVFSALSAGNYTLTVKDANGCTATASTTLTEPNLLTLTATPTNLTCQAKSTGSISLSASGGTMAYTYSKDGLTFQSSNVFSALTAGNYTLTVKDANGCTASASTTLTEPELLTLTTATPTNLTCQSNSTGSISLSASGGTMAYTYSKDGLTFQSNNVFSALSAGNYTLTVKDTNGCTATASTTLTEPNLLTLTATPTNLTCQANSTGSIILSASGGTTAYTYSKDGSTFQSSNVFSALSAGNYTLTVKDANGCTAQTFTTVTQPTVITAKFEVRDILCKNANTGSITSFVNGGTIPYKYNWSNGQTSASIENLSAGVYSLTISDAAGCNITQNISISDGKTTEPPTILDNIVACLGSPISLSNISFGAYNKLVWYENINASISIPEPTSHEIGQRNYFVSQVSQDGCESLRVPVNISINDCKPAAFDLALRKTVVDSKSEFKPNDLVTFNITVYNQGNAKAYNIDVIDYIPLGMIYVGNSWTINSNEIVNRIDSLSIGESRTLTIKMRISSDTQNGDLINKAEIFGADLDKLGKNHLTSDIDSRFDKNPNNDIGGKEDSPTDDYILGNGDGQFDTVGGIIQKYDEDDADPALIRVAVGDTCLDLALRKRLLSNPVTAVYMPSDSVRFEITVFNQCKNQKVYNIDVVDYIPKGAILLKTNDINQRWSLSIDTLMANNQIVSIDTNAITRIDSLAGGDSTTFEILLKIKPTTQAGAYINKSEIFRATRDKDAKFVINADVDSRFDKNPSNDIGGKENSPTDDYILGDGNERFDTVGGVKAKNDEDDEDPAMFVVGDIDCLQASVDSVNGNKWFDLYDNFGRLYASVNPNGQNLGRVTLKIRHYGNGEENIPATSFGTRLMSRYFDIKSSLKDSFDVAVSLKIYFLDTELNDYKKAVKLPLLTINDFNIVHYDGIRENCGFEDNDNFTQGVSEVLYKNIIGKVFSKESFYLQFDLHRFSEIGATANKYMTTIQYDVSKHYEKSALVVWTTNLEVESNYFIVERSTDCVNFVQIGKVSGKGVGSDYEFIDNFPNSGINCYRIIYVDKDGTRKVLDPKQVEFDKTPICTAFPNPVIKGIDFNAYYRNIKVKEIKLYDTIGQEIGLDATLTENNYYKIKVSNIMRNVNYLVFTDEKGKRCIMRVVAH